MPISFGELLFINGLVILEHKSKQLSSVPNDVKIIINAIN